MGILKEKTQSGNVRYSPEADAIIIDVHGNGSYEYDIPMSRCQTAGACLDWLHQIHAKIWGPKHMADLTEIMFTRIPSTLWSGKG